MPKTIRTKKRDLEHRYTTSDGWYYHTYAQCRDALIKSVAKVKGHRIGDYGLVGYIEKWYPGSGNEYVDKVCYEVTPIGIVFSGNYCPPGGYNSKKWSKTVKR